MAVALPVVIVIVVVVVVVSSWHPVRKSSRPQFESHPHCTGGYGVAD